MVLYKVFLAEEWVTLVSSAKCHVNSMAFSLLFYKSEFFLTTKFRVNFLVDLRMRDVLKGAFHKYLV